MSEQEKFEQEEKDEVEAHKKNKNLTDEPSADEDSSDDFEAHKKVKQ